MSKRRSQRLNPTGSRPQRGFAIVLMLLVMVSAGAYFLLRSLNQAARTTTIDNTTERALLTARDALVGFAVRYPDNPSVSDDNAGPGHLPCPKTNLTSAAGQSDLSCGSLASEPMVGLFPWRTVKVPETRDGSGAALWYAVSKNFRYNPKTPINSETRGTLRLDSCAADDEEIVAIIIAPGPPLAHQDRDAGELDTENYLEGANADANADNCFSSKRDATHNDLVLALTRRDLMRAVEHRVLNDVKNALRRYYADPDGDDDEGNVDPDCVGLPQCDDSYPWLSPFTNPKTNTYTGTLCTRHGLLPLRRVATDGSFDAAFTASWSIPGGTVTPEEALPPAESCLRSSAGLACTLAGHEMGSVNPEWLSGRCRNETQNELRCSATRVASDGTQREYELVLTNWPHKIVPPAAAATRLQSFVATEPLSAGISLSITLTGRDCVGTCTEIGKATLDLASGEAITSFALNVPFDLEIDVDGEIDQAPRRSPGELPQWFSANKWEQLIHVAYGDAHGPAKNNPTTCDAPSEYLTVKWKRDPLAEPSVQDQIPALLVMAGAELSGITPQNRDIALLSDYLESDNATEDDVFFRSPAGVDFNDSILILDPLTDE